AGLDLADLHAHRLLVRAPARAARSSGAAHAAARRRRRVGGLDGRLFAGRVPAWGGCPGQPGAGPPDRAWGGRGHRGRAADVGDRPPQPRGGPARRPAPPPPARLHNRWFEPAVARMSTLERVRPSDPRVPVSPQLALRVAVLGGLAMALFAIIFFRLWY